MSWITGADPNDPAAAALFEADAAAAGYVHTYTRIFGHRPDVYRAWAGLNGAVKASMAARHYELATLAAALRLRSSYCALAHGQVLAERLGAADEVRAVAAGRADALDPADAAVVRLADKVAAGAADMRSEDLDELRGLGWSDAEILDVVLAAAARCFFSTVLDAVGAQPDRDFLDLPEPLRSALVVGRPIAGERDVSPLAGRP